MRKLDKKDIAIIFLVIALIFTLADNFRMRQNIKKDLKTMIEITEIVNEIDELVK